MDAFLISCLNQIMMPVFVICVCAWLYSGITGHRVDPFRIIGTVIRTIEKIVRAFARAGTKLGAAQQGRRYPRSAPAKRQAQKGSTAQDPTDTR